MISGRPPSVRPGPTALAPGAAWEAAWALLALAMAWHFLALRIRGGGLPQGDEGSWMAVAAELARGNGFTTRWLEAHFLEPYALPRPDDFRYPVLTSLLALQFKIWGFSLETARWTVAGVFLAFSASAFLVCRAAFGRWPAMAGLWLMAASLLQLELNSAVYTEGMFGLVAAGLAAWCLRGERPAAPEGAPAWRSFAWWAVLGAGTGVLYLVRVNAILFLPGVFLLAWTRRKPSLSWKHPAAALAAFLLVVSPWLLHMALSFGNPLHFAGSGGLLRDPGQAQTQSHTLSLVEYFSRHDVLFPLRRMALGAYHFVANLHAFEHGLQAVPLLLALGAAALRRSFFNPFLAAGFLLTWAGSIYAAYNSWAGVRYMCGLLPFAYAYGLALVPSLPAVQAALRLLDRTPLPARWSGLPRAAVGALAIALLLAPVLHPHRFYVRKFSGGISERGSYDYRRDLADHVTRLEARLPAEGRYYAASLCRVNFLSEGSGCVGLQELYDPTWFRRSLEAFRPGLIVLTHAETRDSTLRAALARMRAEGYVQDTLETGALAVYLSLHPADGSRGKGP